MIDYANEKESEYVISNNKNSEIKSINDIDMEIIELLIQNRNNRINVEFDDSNELLKKFEELSL